MLFDLFFDIRGQEFCLEGEPFNFIEPNFKSTINILVENFIPQNPGGQGQRMAHGDDFIYLAPSIYAGYLTRRRDPHCPRHICRVPHKEMGPTVCGSRLLVRCPAYMLGTWYTPHGDMGSLPTEKDCTQFRRTEWQYSFFNISGRGPVVS